VQLLEHTGAYATFANEGVKADARTILRIEDANGTVIEDIPVNSRRVLDRDVALMMSDVLSDNVARTPLWGSFSLVNFGNRDVAIKSGSTNNLRDAWIMGYTPNLAVGAWVGNNDNSVMGGGLSGLITTPMWRAFMDVALEKVEPQTFPLAPPIDQNIKPILRGQVVDSNSIITTAQESGADINLDTIMGNMHNILHFVDKNNPRGPVPTNPAADDQYQNWEYAVQQWKLTQISGLVPSAEETNETPTTNDEN
jgi:penicillin-binding protein 1A